MKQSKTNNRLTGISYTTWHMTEDWENWSAWDCWGKPQLGYYRSDNRDIIRQHARWLADVGVDFLFVDWSNNLGYNPTKEYDNLWFEMIKMIEDSTTVMFDELSKMSKNPKICIMAGITGNPDAISDGSLQQKVDQIYNEFLSYPDKEKIYQKYLGKPLLIIYVDTPTPFPDGLPEWDDSRFTIRWMTGYVTEQSFLTDNKISKYGYWSWEDRGEQTYTMYNGQPEAMTVVPSWRGDPGGNKNFKLAAGKRENGQTFRKQWERAREIGVKIVLNVSWNEWKVNEQPSPEVSKDIEPSVRYGELYLEILKEEISKFKGEVHND